MSNQIVEHTIPCNENMGVRWTSVYLVTSIDTDGNAWTNSWLNREDADLECADDIKAGWQSEVRQVALYLTGKYQGR